MFSANYCDVIVELIVIKEPVELRSAARKYHDLTSCESVVAPWPRFDG
jgi:hypothetical protein